MGLTEFTEDVLKNWDKYPFKDEKYEQTHPETEYFVIDGFRIRNDPDELKMKYGDYGYLCDGMTFNFNQFSHVICNNSYADDEERCRLKLKAANGAFEKMWREYSKNKIALDDKYEILDKTSELGNHYLFYHRPPYSFDELEWGIHVKIEPIPWVLSKIKGWDCTHKNTYIHLHLERCYIEFVRWFSGVMPDADAFLKKKFEDLGFVNVVIVLNKGDWGCWDKDLTNNHSLNMMIDSVF